MRVYTVLMNIVQRIKNAVQESKDYTEAVAETKLTNELLLGNMQSTVSINGNGTAWVLLTCPSDRKIFAYLGAYWYGTNNSNVFSYANWQTSDTTIQFAFRNTGSAAASITVSANYLYTNVGGGNA